MLRREAVAGTTNMAVANLESQLGVVELSKGKNAMKKHREVGRGEAQRGKQMILYLSSEKRKSSQVGKTRQ